MAKLRKRRLRWTASSSSQIVGYKLYWAVGAQVNYDSASANVGMRTEVILPDDVPSFPLINGKVELGITAVNEIGSESDMVRISAPFEFRPPDAPSGLLVENLEDFHIEEVSERDFGGSSPP